MSILFDTISIVQRKFIRLLQFIVTRVLAIWYRGESKGIPTPKSSILMESATSLANRIRCEKTTSYEVVRAFIDRINEINDILNCVVDNRFEEALEEAKKADELIASHTKTKKELQDEMPLLGVPFTTKDSIGIVGLVHAAGFKARRNTKAEKDAAVISLMRKAGAIPLAVTNVSELCLWWESNNPTFGTTKNPYNINRSAGGSSGGEACLIASCGSPVGIGSDIGGSIRIPGAFNGIFGHKPSGEITPLEGLFPKMAQSQMPFNTVGPMSRFSTDLLPVLKVITSQCSVDLKLDEEVDIKKLKYYYMEDDGGQNLLSPVGPEVKAAIVKIVGYLKKSYGIVAQKVNITNLRNAHEIWKTKMTAEHNSQIRSLLAKNEEKINISKEMLKVPFGLSEHTMATLLVALTEETADPPGTLKHRIHLNMGSQLSKEFEEMLGTDGIFIYPTQPTTALYHHESLFKPYNYAYTGIFNVLGLPSTQCPVGMSSGGLPIGIQIVGGKYQDRLTIAVAQEIEKAFGGWKPSPTKGTMILKNTALITEKSK